MNHLYRPVRSVAPADGMSGCDARPRPRRTGARTVLAALALVLGTVLSAPGVLAQSTPPSFADLAERVTPAVVNISTTVRLPGQPRMPFPFPEGSPFEEFFKRFGEQFGMPDRALPVPEGHALGSGFVIDPEGYIVTNAHVIERATEIQVTFTDGTQLPARVVGRDPQTDLALLKVDADKELPWVEFGDSDAVRVGDWVIAVGNPFGLGGTVSAGIVSARGRDIQAGPYDDFLQIDAPINPGNSGGPTFAMDGKVVGVNTAIASPTGGNVGIGFAIPSNMAKEVIEDLRDDGRVQRGWLGVQIQRVTPELAEALGLDEPRGAIIAGIMPDGPAADSELKQGDVILTFDGKPIREMRDLPRIVAVTPPGKTVRIEVWRNGRTETVRVRVGQQAVPEETAQVEPAEPASPASTVIEVPELGAKLAATTPEIAKRFGLSSDTKGVVIVEVAPNGPAAAQGLRPGDLIERVSQQEVETPADVERLAQAARKAEQSSLLLLVNRQGNSLYVAVKLA
mgnify:CR=1 FL=1